jgi:type II secretory pathway pseudopilin PulG
MHQQQQRSLRSNQLGFSLIQLLITLAVAAIVSTFAAMGITRARASMRLSNSTRQFAAYVERARADAVRRHGQASVQLLTTSSYSATMDFGAGGVVTTQTFPLETNVTFITELKTISFDWRGRIATEISVGFSNEAGTANVNITGSGDVTVDSEIFHDASVPSVAYNANASGDVIADPVATPASTPASTPTPTPSPSVSPTATPTPSASPTATPNHGHQATPTPTPTPTPTATPTPTPTPNPSPTPTPCSITVAPNPITIVQNGSGVVAAVLSNFDGTTTITATSGNSGQIQVSPASRTISGIGSASFTITVKRQSGSVTLDSSCGSKTVTVTVP